ncbi:UDP-2,3-diacylglucosamine diphosphatase [Dokdonella sp.]|uniref:UDP-2,3-diacylglucosamine diphosphatase n=1 Tax=Dokdonella sp. TaxID=2291710 RepID=UPI003C53D93D
MSTLFISDLHLDLSRPEIIRQFENFIRDEAVQADALYILGDLFEAWIGDDADSEIGQRFIDAMQPMRDAGRPAFFMHGNRDFLLGERYARKAGLTLLPDPSVINIHGTPTLMMHGDSLCIDDETYQAFRTLSRSPEWQRSFLARTTAERQAFADAAREESMRHTRDGNNETIMDVNQKAVESAMHKSGVYRLIHGHTHRPNTHGFQLSGPSAERIVLGDWYEQGSSVNIKAGP